MTNPRTDWTFTAETPDDTDRLGAALAKALPDGTMVSLSGTLGAGKTHLVRAVVAACGVPADQVVSPTYVLCQEYHGTRTVYHMDVYRLADEDEFLNLGPEEYFYSSGLTFIEWAERVQSCLPDARVEVVIDVLPTGGREFRFRLVGNVDEGVLERLASEMIAQ